jgi:hypothetical protein
MKDELDDVSDAIVDIDPVNKFLFKKIKIQFGFSGTFELLSSCSLYR